MSEDPPIVQGDRDAPEQAPVSAQKNRSAQRGDDRRQSFIERFCVTEAPPDLEEVEAAIDAEPPRPWERWAPLAIVGFTVGFWATVIWLFVR